MNKLVFEISPDFLLLHTMLSNWILILIQSPWPYCSWTHRGHSFHRPLWLLLLVFNQESLSSGIYLSGSFMLFLCLLLCYHSRKVTSFPSTPHYLISPFFPHSAFPNPDLIVCIPLFWIIIIIDDSHTFGFVEENFIN